eukprot:jgi/Chlat1/1706/Chrsp127S01936
MTSVVLSIVRRAVSERLAGCVQASCSVMHSSRACAAPAASPQFASTSSHRNDYYSIGQLAQRWRRFATRTSNDKSSIQVTFVDKDGTEQTVAWPSGTSLLDVAHEHDIELEGACEGSLACSTCHVIVEDQEYYDKMPEPTDEENDMLDLAFGLTDRSRLGCQIKSNLELNGLRVALPSATRNMAVDGYVPKPH